MTQNGKFVDVNASNTIHIKLHSIKLNILVIV